MIFIFNFCADFFSLFFQTFFYFAGLPTRRLGYGGGIYFNSSLSLSLGYGSGFGSFFLGSGPVYPLPLAPPNLGCFKYICFK